MLPLEGIRTIELSHMVMGPTVGVILGDLGANVIKIEPPGGDKTRRLKGSGAGYFAMYNRNKRSICANLKSDAGRQVAYRLIDQADVFIENFRAGAMDQLGFGYDELHKRNPGLVYCSLKGFLSGPYGNRTALDEVAQMMGGLAYMTGPPNQPLRAGASVIDVTGGMFGVIAILAALMRRKETGYGEHLVSSLFETTAFLVGQHMAQEAVTGEPAPPMAVRRSAWSVYETFETADGDQVFVAVVSDALWERFCAEFKLDELTQDESLNTNTGRVEQRPRFIPMLVQMFLSMSTTEVLKRLENAGVPFAPINTPTDLFEDEHLLAGGGLLQVSLVDGINKGKQTCLPALPVEFANQKFGLRNDLPAAGQDTDDVLLEFGFSETEVGNLRKDGVVS